MFMFETFRRFRFGRLIAGAILLSIVCAMTGWAQTTVQSSLTRRDRTGDSNRRPRCLYLSETDAGERSALD
jgi:hypothetical protein